ncbi:MAG: MBOAT family protein [Prevotellaceae bacterium]|jgi:D-alanyl-lipoteichoic acid acyltransferase DltB (MBOAT superfamily)|nr:MBOAT family protein [Prevotellaceae bacterium]
MFPDFLKEIFVFDSHSPLLFTQFYFWAFFAVVFAGFAALKNRILLRNTYLAFFSLFFYYKTGGFFVLLLIFNILANMWVGRAIFRSNTESQRRMYLVIGLIINLLVLCYYKYAYLFVEMLNTILGINLQVFDLFAWTGNVLNGTEKFNTANILLPVGISFYTFHNISYIMDIFRRKVEPVKNFFNYTFYVSFFPQLVAGPIVRASEFIPQIYKPYFLGRKQFGIAIFWIINGLAKKIILSDYIAVNFVDRVFENPLMFSSFENLMALFGYSLQVYADFSGYTDIAIGVAMLFGFYLPKNFNSPYKATNAGNFWKRWHISLSRWLQDYLYISLGGNRNATFATYITIITIALIAALLSGSIWVAAAILTVVIIIWLLIRYKPDKKKKITTNLNMMNTMLLGGLWHGASWNFMIWGGLNGIGMLIFKFWKNKNLKIRTLILLTFSLIFGILFYKFQYPVFKIGFVWLSILFIGTLIRLIYNILSGKRAFTWLEMAWAVLQTFVFITFTRLFFRSGSNLDPSEANQTAWNTAKNMVSKIGGKWDFSLIDNMIYEYRSVFIWFVIGMIIHWLPEHFKRRYRLWFASMPLWLMAAVAVLSVFIIYQFISADLQSFIYFQF